MYKHNHIGLDKIDSEINTIKSRLNWLYETVSGNTKRKPGRPPKTEKSAHDIIGTAYIVLTDGTVARRLKPSKAGNKKYFNLVINGKLKAYDAEIFKRYANSQS